MYRGVLPPEFCDLTWVEEMVCALYRNTAHITRLYGSSDPGQPTVLHGNTCAHEMNVISTATVLPRTPADINDMLSIVFIGAKKPDSKSLKHIFRVRKQKICDFLDWLRVNNTLYSNIPIVAELMDLYPDDDVLPGIDGRILHDKESSPEKLFDEETAGFQPHPAALLKENPAAEAGLLPEPVVMIEKMGVSDLESDRVPGRVFTAAAL
ncbi:hypothetical protein NP233_g12331 [Leucocoprinus birnbaumii]|uniref:DUF6570 domain-containing protein n=1 Tax=Leucocoprinus birnbaumii TaxID=56174 RepID=A0AAD5VKB8_9AGAR|nr:hypothetical protein NP233_g12331 [Leucocoprinus birnbaumii]